jgi:hypothetical protein
MLVSLLTIEAARSWATQGRTWRLAKPGGILHTQRVDYNTLNLMMFFVLIMFFSHWMVSLLSRILLGSSICDGWAGISGLFQGPAGGCGRVFGLGV